MVKLGNCTFAEIVVIAALNWWLNPASYVLIFVSLSISVCVGPLMAIQLLPLSQNIEWKWRVRMGSWVKAEFLIHRSIQDQCVQVGDLTMVITEEQVLLPYCSPLWALISVSENTAENWIWMYFKCLSVSVMQINKYTMGNWQLVSF